MSAAASPPEPILCIGFSPAWQRVYRVGSYDPGDVVRSSAVSEFASGKSTNAARHAARDVTAVGRRPVTHLVPLGSGGDRFVRFGVEVDGVETIGVPSASPLRSCTTVLESSGRATELIENAGPLGDRFRLDDLLSVVEANPAAAMVLSGSLPRDLPSDAFAQCIAAATVRGPVVIDAVGPPLTHAIDAGASVVKINAEELAKTTGRECPTVAAAVDAAGSLVGKSQVSVVITRGADATIVVADDDVTLVQPPAVDGRIVSVIGAGDALAGRLAAELAEADQLAEAVARATAYVAAYLQHDPLHRLAPNDWTGWIAECVIRPWQRD